MSPTSGSVISAAEKSDKNAKTTDSPDEIVVTINRAGLSQGTYTDQISVSSNAGDATVNVSLEVGAGPVLSVSSTQLDFGDNLTGLSFYISNTGSGSLDWTLSGSASWLGIVPVSGSTTSETDQIDVNVYRTGLAAGHYSAQIVVASNAGNAIVNVEMDVVPPTGDPVLSVSTDTLDFGSVTTTLVFIFH